MHADWHGLHTWQYMCMMGSNRPPQQRHSVPRIVQHKHLGFLQASHDHQSNRCWASLAPTHCILYASNGTCTQPRQASGLSARERAPVYRQV